MIAEERSIKQEQRRLGTAKSGGQYAKGQGKSSLRLKSNNPGNQSGLRSSGNGIPFPS